MLQRQASTSLGRNPRILSDVACFTDFRRYNGDVDGFVTGSEQMAARKSASSSHTVCPVVVTVNGNRAVSESIGTILVRFTYDGGSYDCCSHGLFVSRLERSDDEWKMLSLEVIYDRDSIQSVTPSSNNIGIEVDPKARESYRCLAWVLAQNGFSVDQTLPGTDDPGSAEDLMSRSFKWLKAQ